MSKLAPQPLIIRHLSDKDEVLRAITAEIAWPEGISTHNVFHDLMSCIIEQQVHYRSSKKTFAKLLAQSSLEELTTDNFEAFEEMLGKVELSTGKYETMVAVVDFFRGRTPDWPNLSDAEVREVLDSIKGVGPWTVEMILLYTLERPDVFPARDYHLKQLMVPLYGLGPRRIVSEMKKIAERWSPYRSFAVKYLLAWKETNPRKKL